MRHDTAGSGETATHEVPQPELTGELHSFAAESGRSWRVPRPGPLAERTGVIDRRPRVLRPVACPVSEGGWASYSRGASTVREICG